MHALINYVCDALKENFKLMVLSSDEVDYVVSNNSTYVTEASVRFNFYSRSFEYGIETYLVYIVLLASFCILSRMGLFVRSLFRTNFVVKKVSVCWVFDEGCFFMLKDLFVVCKLKEKIQILLVFPFSKI